MSSSAAASLENIDTEDQTHLLWEDLQWPFPLDQNNVMVYFERSPFFDLSSTNMLARRDGKDPTQPGVLESYPPGLEFVIAHSQVPHLFVIKRQLRRPGGVVTPLAFYYIIDKKVYQAPSLHAAITNRVQRCLWQMRQAFTKLQKDLDPVSALLREEERRQADPEGTGLRQAEAAKKPLAVRKKLTDQEVNRWRRFDNIIMNVLKQHPPPQLPPEYFQLNSQDPLTATSQPPNQHTAAAGGDGAGEKEQPVGSTAAADGTSQEPTLKRQRV